MKQIANSLIAVLMVPAFTYAQLLPELGEATLELNMVDETLTLFANKAPCGNDPTCLGIFTTTLTSPMANLNIRSGPLGIVLGLTTGTKNDKYVEFSPAFVNVDGTFDLSILYNFSAGIDPGLSYRGEGFEIFDANVVVIESLCDFSNDSMCDVADINMMFAKGNLVTEVSTASGDRFDMNDDLVINQTDIDLWLDEAATENGYSSPYKRGDTDGLGAVFSALRDVDITDFNALAANFDPSGSNALTNTWDLGNFDGDDDIDITDFNFLGTNFASSGYGVQTIPEPHALVLLTFALITCLAKRPRGTRPVARR